jgi:hypothetical protein
VIPSKYPVDSNKPSVGRISVDSIPPPHTSESIMRCISQIEKLNISPVQSQLFTSILNESPIGEEHVSVLTDSCPGSAAEDPMAFVVGPFDKRIRVIQSSWGQLKFTSRGKILCSSVFQAAAANGWRPQMVKYYTPLMTLLGIKFMNLSMGVRSRGRTAYSRYSFLYSDCFQREREAPSPSSCQ